MTDKINARYVVIIGEDEATSNSLTIKNLSDGEQITVPMENVDTYFSRIKLRERD